MKIGLQGDLLSAHSVEIHFSHLAIELLSYPNYIYSFIESDRQWPLSDLGFELDDVELLTDLMRNSTSQYDQLDLLLTLGGRVPKVKCTTLLCFSMEFNTPRFDLKGLFNENFVAVLPSNWCKKILLNSNCPESFVHVLNEGVNTKYFYPLPEINRNIVRENLNIDLDSFVFLNVSALTYNKGIDILLQSYEAYRKSCATHSILILKDLSHVYGVGAMEYVRDLVSSGIISADVAEHIRIVSGNLTFSQLNELYNIADCYVAPYRAEGFNAPALQTIACGTPVIVTSGGATDDFVSHAHGWKIDATIHEFAKDTYGLKPSGEHLTELLFIAESTRLKYSDSFSDSARATASHFSYKSVASRYLDLFNYLLK